MNDREELTEIIRKATWEGGIDIEVDAILAAGFRRQEAPKTTMSFDEWWTAFTQTGWTGLWDMGNVIWRAALEHSVELAEAFEVKSKWVHSKAEIDGLRSDLTAYRQRIEELEAQLKEARCVHGFVHNGTCVNCGKEMS